MQRVEFTPPHRDQLNLLTERYRTLLKQFRPDGDNEWLKPQLQSLGLEIAAINSQYANVHLERLLSHLKTCSCALIP